MVTVVICQHSHFWPRRGGWYLIYTFYYGISCSKLLPFKGVRHNPNVEMKSIAGLS